VSEPTLVGEAAASGEAGWPWPRAARSLGTVLLIGGLAAVIGAFTGVRGAASLRDQLAFVATGGIGGIAALGLGAALLVVAELASSQRRIHALDTLVGDSYGDDGHAADRSGETQAFGVTSRRMAATMSSRSA
jgi:hypothetical protein